ncbi:MAG: sulfotransferase [Gemmatimonadota bacterium]
MNSPRPLVHIGYHKTATSWLQRRYFGEPARRWRLCDRGLVGRTLINRHALDFDAGVARDALHPWRSGSGDAEVPVMSHERLSGYPHSGGYDSKELAERIADVLPDARILLVIREQRDILYSSYRQYVVDGGGCRLESYLNPTAMGNSRVPAFTPSYFEYDRLIRTYRRLFDAKDLLVLPFETFVTQPREWLEEVDRFAGLAPGVHPDPVDESQENRGRSATGIALLRLGNRLALRNDLNPSPLVESASLGGLGRRLATAADRRLPRRLGKGMERRQRATIAAYATSRFGDSNRRTRTLTGLDLAELGYDLSPSPNLGPGNPAS